MNTPKLKQERSKNNNLIGVHKVWIEPVAEENPWWGQVLGKIIHFWLTILSRLKEPEVKLFFRRLKTHGVHFGLYHIYTFKFWIFMLNNYLFCSMADFGFFFSFFYFFFFLLFLLFLFLRGFRSYLWFKKNKNKNNFIPIYKLEIWYTRKF